MKIYSYIFYRIYSIYLNKWNDNVPGVYALCAVTLLQVINIYAFYILSSALFSFDPIAGISKSDLISGFFILLTLNYVHHFIVYSFQKYSDIWKEEYSNLRSNRGWLIVGYILLSILLLPIAGYIAF